MNLQAACGERVAKATGGHRVACAPGAASVVRVSNPWLLGIVGPYTVGATVHILLVVAIVLCVVGFVSGRRRVI